MSKNVQLFNNWLLTETLYLKLIRQKEYLKLMNFFLMTFQYSIVFLALLQKEIKINTSEATILGKKL